MLGPSAIAHETHQFKAKFLDANEFPEKIVLKMGVKENGQWDLTICQRRGVPQKFTDSEKVTSSKKLKKRRLDISSNISSPPDYFICPITLEIMKDPVIAQDGYSYERDAIEEWIEKKGTSPMTNLPIEKLLISNRQLKEAIESYNLNCRF